MANENGKSKFELIKILGVLAMVLYILIAQILVPLVRAGNGELTLSERVSKLEVLMERLENIPLYVATQTEAIQNLKKTVEKMDEKLDRHISREPK